MKLIILGCPLMSPDVRGFLFCIICIIQILELIYINIKHDEIH